MTRRGPFLVRALVASLLAALALATAGPAGAATASAPPHLTADAAILVQPDTEDIVFRDHATQRLPIASTTKLMTALLTLENAKLDTTVKAVDYHPGAAESLMGLRGGDKATIRDLLEGLLLPSGNDAAMTLAVRVGGTEKHFVAMMNARAKALGLTQTHYANPVGLDAPDNYSSAEDLAKLALVLLHNKIFARIVDRKSATVDMGGRERTLVNRNTLLQTVPWMDGVKTGHTNHAGYILVGAAKRHGVRLVSVVLGTPSEADRDSDTLALMKWGLRRYQRTAVVKREQPVGTVKLDYRDRVVPIVAARSLSAVVRRGQKHTLRLTGIPGELSGAHDRGERVGTITVTSNGRTLGSVPAVLGEDVAAASITDKIAAELPPLWLVALVVVAAIASLLLAIRHRRRVRRRRSRTRRRGTETA